MLDITIVTSCTPNYSRYLRDWASSIAALRTKPKACAIVENGADLPSEDAMVAISILGAAGVPCRKVVMPATDFGTARNAAVALSDTEWVMHLDADDTIMPHCLEDVAALAPHADVVSLGYRRNGDLKAGPHNLVKTYRTHSGKKTLEDPTPSSGVSPFRRSFWERSPYRTDMQGGWDTALWLGFAHLGARFVPTRRPCFWYRQHADSIFNTRRLDECKSSFVGAKLESLRRGDHGVSVLIPWTDDPRRRMGLKWLRDLYAKERPEWEVLLGECEAPWRKGIAVNHALYHAHGEIVIVADADCYVPLSVLDRAVERVRLGAPWVVPHRLVHRLDECSTQSIMQGAAPGPHSHTIRRPYEGFAGGGVFVVERAKLAAVRGYPDRFTGWGAEDEAMALVFDTLVGEHERFEEDLWHLWHPPGARNRDPSYRMNRALFQHYASASGDRELMWAVVNGMPGAVRPGHVRMRALADFNIGADSITAGTYFWATVEEARRHAHRHNRLAVPAGAMPNASQIIVGGPIYSNFQDRRLAEIALRKKRA